MTAQTLEVVALALFALFVLLGLRVSKRPLSRTDERAIWFRGQLTPLALAFTLSGRAIALTAACAISVAIFAVLRLPLAIALIVAASQLLSQIVVELLKPLFGRMRPDYWLSGLDAGHSYPSGHATTAVVFFAGWACIVALGRLPQELKTALLVALAVWAAGIIWSRLALGAHYLTDVAGGVLFGAAWLCALFALVPHFYVVLR